MGNAEPWGREHAFLPLWVPCVPLLALLHPIWSSATLPSPGAELCGAGEERGGETSDQVLTPLHVALGSSLQRFPWTWFTESGVQIRLGLSMTVSWQTEIKCCLKLVPSPIELLSTECGHECLFCLDRKTASQGLDINVSGGTPLSSV